MRNERKVYLLLNKPKDYVTTTDDPKERKTVMLLVAQACSERIYPVGRLDRHTTGVLLFTNDGEMAKKLTHPSHNKKKIYHVFLDKSFSAGDLKKLAQGITLDDGFIQPDAISYASKENKREVGLEIHSGQNRIVRRMFESLGYRVVKLDRVYYAGLTKKDLPRGKWRFLTEKEVNRLKMNAYE
jgi:23S rRNA pseudouridine2605 synthase